MTTSPRAEGAMAASAGRSISGRVFTTILASAISAPVLPAETTPEASPLATASMAMRMELCRPWRSAAVGFISAEMTSGAWRSMQALAARGRRASMAPIRASSPTSRKRACGWRSAASSMPSSTISGALSPPMASIARAKGGRRRVLRHCC